MKYIFNYFLLAALILSVACNNAQDANEQNIEAQNQLSAEATESHEGKTTQVSLDNGKKWKANQETIDGIHKMQTIVRNGSAADAAPGTLSEPLKQEFQTIFEKCTMKGEAHEQLHNYLMPVKGYLDQLNDGNTGVKALSDLDAHLLTFQNYFE